MDLRLVWDVLIHFCWLMLEGPATPAYCGWSMCIMCAALRDGNQQEWQLSRLSMLEGLQRRTGIALSLCSTYELHKPNASLVNTV